MKLKKEKQWACGCEVVWGVKMNLLGPGQHKANDCA